MSDFVDNVLAAIGSIAIVCLILIFFWMIFELYPLQPRPLPGHSFDERVTSEQKTEITKTTIAKEEAAPKEAYEATSLQKADLATLIEATKESCGGLSSADYGAIVATLRKNQRSDRGGYQMPEIIDGVKAACEFSKLKGRNP